MKLVFKFLYYFCITFIVLIFLTAAIIRFSPLDFASKEYDEIFDILFFGGIPVAILLTACRIGFQSMDRTKKRNTIIIHFLLSLGCFFLFFLYALVSFGEGMCLYSDEETLFVNRSNPSTTITLRSYGCGATDSGPSSLSVELRKMYSPVFCSYTKVDTTRIDRKEWTRTTGH
ncbi:MAG TPA: hypothetical protein PLU11_13615 [Chitinophagaceae bacterium]|nr:hypothetical protein [Chitinophagaceae bacterium]HPH33047.1 hypothetical protein [Chitinophagaceae bacterium]HPN60218.1 hypothetical protein [Chitinophagaceae bacterium]